MNQGVRGGKVIELKKTVDEAVSSCPMVRQVFVAMRTEKPVELTARDVAMEEVRDQNVLININHLHLTAEDGAFTCRLEKYVFLK